jgi:unsaturated rhamnogalacturonyl hydrolase
MPRILLLAVTLGLAAPARASSLPATDQTLAAMRRAADWQLAHLHDVEPRAANPRGWVQASFWLGLTALADRTAEPRYAARLLALGAAQRWQLGARNFHADDHLIGAIWLWAYRHTGEAASIVPLRARFEAILAAPPRVALDFDDDADGDRPCQLRWCWCDALFMAPPVWASLSRVSGDPRFLAFADTEFRATEQLLFDAREGLFLRDSRFLQHGDENGRKIFWSRGNGWVFAGIARLLDEIPADDGRRGHYEALFRRMAARLLLLQGRDGYWPASLLSDAATPETSGTALIVYGLAWGVRAGLLDRAAVIPAIERGWAALLGALGPDGRLGWVQPIGSAPDRVGPDDTQPYGVGAFLLAGGQVADLAATESR